MEDVFKFLLVAAVIVIGLVKQFKKEANKNAGKAEAGIQTVRQTPIYFYKGFSSLPGVPSARIR